MFPSLPLYDEDSAQRLMAAGSDLDDQHRDLSDLSVRGVQYCKNANATPTTWVYLKFSEAFSLQELFTSLPPPAPKYFGGG